MARSMLAAVLVVVLAHAGTPAFQEQEAPEEQSTAEQSTWDQVLEMYEKAKAAGEQVPQDVYQWLKDDLGSIGDWEYLVTEISMSNTEALQDRLNELGTERWECVWIHNSKGKTVFVFKRPTRSYLKNVPLSQLMKLVPTGDSAGE